MRPGGLACGNARQTDGSWGAAPRAKIGRCASGIRAKADCPLESIKCLEPHYFLRTAITEQIEPVLEKIIDILRENDAKRASFSSPSSEER
jgi:hypothetical protein